MGDSGGGGGGSLTGQPTHDYIIQKLWKGEHRWRTGRLGDGVPVYDIPMESPHPRAVSDHSVSRLKK